MQLVRQRPLKAPVKGADRARPASRAGRDDDASQRDAQAALDGASRRRTRFRDALLHVATTTRASPAAAALCGALVRRALRQSSRFRPNGDGSSPKTRRCARWRVICWAEPMATARTTQAQSATARRRRARAGVDAPHRRGAAAQALLRSAADAAQLRWSSVTSARDPPRPAARAASASGRTSGCPKNGSRPTACPASPCRSTWRIRACMRLERRFMDEVEGGNANWLTRILRHEIGARARQRLPAAPAQGLAQDVRQGVASVSGHLSAAARRAATSCCTSVTGTRRAIPTEDFAETFAVWLQPRARWRREYQGWPALRKLEYVDELMAEHSRRAARRRAIAS